MTRRLLPAALALLVLVALFVALRPASPGRGPGERSFNLSIRGGAMQPAELNIREGDRVTLSVTADRELELHLHGYDRELALEPGVTAEDTFEAELTGRFEIEDEETGKHLGALIVEPR